jgi:hypothetical protein
MAFFRALIENFDEKDHDSYILDQCHTRFLELRPGMRVLVVRPPFCSVNSVKQFEQIFLPTRVYTTQSLLTFCSQMGLIRPWHLCWWMSGEVNYGDRVIHIAASCRSLASTGETIRDETRFIDGTSHVRPVSGD